MPTSTGRATSPIGEIAEGLTEGLVLGHNIRQQREAMKMEQRRLKLAEQEMESKNNYYAGRMDMLKATSEAKLLEQQRKSQESNTRYGEGGLEDRKVKVLERNAATAESVNGMRAGAYKKNVDDLVQHRKALRSRYTGMVALQTERNKDNFDKATLERLTKINLDTTSKLQKVLTDTMLDDGEKIRALNTARDTYRTALFGAGIPPAQIDELDNQMSAIADTLIDDMQASQQAEEQNNRGLLGDIMHSIGGMFSGDQPTADTDQATEGADNSDLTEDDYTPTDIESGYTPTPIELGEATGEEGEGVNENPYQDLYTPEAAASQSAPPTLDEIQGFIDYFQLDKEDPTVSDWARAWQAGEFESEEQAMEALLDIVEKQKSSSTTNTTKQKLRSMKGK